VIQPRLHATSVRDGRSATLFVPRRRKAEHRGCRVIRLTPLFKELLNTATSQVGGSLRFRRALFDLIDELGKNKGEAFALPCMQLPSSPGLIRVVEFLLANLDSVSVPKLARQAGMSERTSIGSYLGHTRMIKAMQLLIDDRGRSVSEVSISVGFNNPSAFACAFRRATGMSPVQFRGASFCKP
jgi:AraC-like DNA-binding protein